MSNVRVRLFGAPQLQRGSDLVQTDTRKAVALLAVLLLDGPQGRESLAALLWPELDEQRARAALRRTLSPLRAALGKSVLEAGRDLVGLAPGASVWSDVTAFRDGLSRVAAHHSAGAPLCPACRHELEGTVSLATDDFLAGFSLRDSLPFDDWQQLRAEGLRRALAGALALQVADGIARGDFASALTPARRWLELDPLHEEAHRQLMRLYAWAGDRAAALRQYRACTRVLAEELGVFPLPETTALNEQIQANDLPAPPSPHLPTSPSPHLPTSSSPHLPTPSALHFPLVGRSAELSRLREIYARVGPDGRFVALTGEAGIGKSRLAAEFLEGVRASGGRVLSATCYEGESGLAFAPVMQALSAALAGEEGATALEGLPESAWVETARLVPAIRAQGPGLPPAPALEGPGGQARFFSGLAEAVSHLAGTGGAFFLDDAHWADSATLDLVTFLVHRLQGRPFLVLAAWREGALGDVPRLRALLAEAARAGTGLGLELARLDAPAVERLVDGWLASGVTTPEASLVRRLHEETEGLPFFVVSFLQSVDLADPAGWPLPRDARDLLRSRLEGVDETGLQLLQTAAVIGRAFDFELLQAASGRSEEESVAGLEGLLRRGLVRELDEAPIAPRYDFSHERLRAYIYEETSLARRRLLHRRLAEALADTARRRGELSPRVGRVAEQYRLAGQDALAATYYRLAGDHARALAANREALSHYQTALALGATDTVALHLESGDLQVLLGQYDAARDSYETAAASSTGAALARVEHRLGQLASRQGDYEWAARQFAQAEANAGTATDVTPVWLAQVQADWSLVAYRLRVIPEALQRAVRARALAERAGDEAALAQAHNILGILERARGDLDAARAHLETSQVLAEAAGQPEARVAVLNNLALLEGDAGNDDQARVHLETALELCVAYGDRHREAALRSNLADILHRQGQAGAALAQLKQSVAISAEIGGDAATALPEIWKLTEW